MNNISAGWELARKWKAHKLISLLLSTAPAVAESGPSFTDAPATLSNGRALEGRGGGRVEWNFKLAPTYRLWATDVTVWDATRMMRQFK